MVLREFEATCSYLGTRVLVTKNVWMLNFSWRAAISDNRSDILATMMWQISNQFMVLDPIDSVLSVDAI